MTSVRELTTDAGTTRKKLWRLFDGALVECVLMRYPDRVTMCVSSQAGCGMNCPFCATGQAGLTRNLSTGEIVEQVVAGARALASGDVPGGPGRVNNVVFMGMGEPLANYKSVVARCAGWSTRRPDGPRACRRAASPCRPSGWSRRSTSWPTRGSRSRWPVAARTRRRAAQHARPRQHALGRRGGARRRLGLRPRTERRVSIEYALIKDINDQAWRADLLGEALSATSWCT